MHGDGVGSHESRVTSPELLCLRRHAVHYCFDQSGDGELLGFDVDWEALFAQSCGGDGADGGHADAVEVGVAWA